MTLERLNQYKDLEKELKQLETEIDILQSKIELQSIIISDMPKCTVNKDLLVKLVDLKRKLEIQQTIVFTERAIIEDYINNVENTTIRTAMRYRFVKGYSWRKIGMTMHYNEDSIRRRVSKYLKSPQKSVLSVYNVVL